MLGFGFLSVELYTRISLNYSSGKPGRAERWQTAGISRLFPSVWGIFLYLPLTLGVRIKGGKDIAISIHGYAVQQCIALPKIWILTVM